MKVTSFIASLCVLGTHQTHGFAFQNAFKVTRTSTRATSKIAMMAKPKKEAKGVKAYSRSTKFVINPNASESEGTVIINAKTGEVLEATTAPPRIVKPTKFQEVGTIELYCKAGPDGASLGDCPFTQYVNMVLQYKKLPFELKPFAPDSKPEWLIEDHDGKMPCMVHNGEAYTESDEIVRYLNFFFPKYHLTDEDSEEDIESAMEVTANVFPLLAKCIKNTDPEQDGEMIEELMEELRAVEEFMEDNEEGDYICGPEFTLADCSFAPKLYHLKTALAQFKNTIVPQEMVRLNAYMERVFNHPAFIASSYPPDVIVWGWNNARGTSAK
mmetsp:Transcript_10893/g.16251  ORF Transcript_10893/g.16251 Transcript_10893/m.16251 type:complete len:327 (-) Transcript_10893:52-1032(-)